MKITETPDSTSPATPPTLPPSRNLVLDIQPLGRPASFLNVIEALLKQPGRILHECREGDRKVPLRLLLATVACLTVFGVLLGAFSGGTQAWAAPLKVVGGVIVALTICLPSLYIFSALGGLEARLLQVAGMLLTAITLASVLLLGFAPVMWIFSQSTESVAFMGFLALLFWTISTFFGFRLLLVAAGRFGMSMPHYLKVWMGIFFLVTLQMSTALRPIIGTADTLLPVKKKFFMEHWYDELNKENETKPAR